MKKFLILLVIIFTCQSVLAQDIKKISLPEALDIAVENNIDYKL